MRVLVTDSSDAIRHACNTARQRGLRVGFVPTMGALHEGHLSLIQRARDGGADYVLVSIFVNPLQFGPSEDLHQYPRTLEADLGACRSAGAAGVYHPEPSEFYPSDFQTEVAVGELATMLEGARRPGHFPGVTTVVTKLFNIVGPCDAVFGRKDYQQWRVIDRMVRDLALPVRVIGHPIVREVDGVALSSRNRYLTREERERATALSTALLGARRAWDGGQRDPSILQKDAESAIVRSVDRLDYVACREPDNLRVRLSLSDVPLLMAVAAWVGDTRLIDNTVLGEDDFAIPESAPEARGVRA